MELINVEADGFAGLATWAAGAIEVRSVAAVTFAEASVELLGRQFS